MNAVEVLKKLEAAKEYLAWKKEHPKCVLAHLFVMFDEVNKDEVQIGFYDADAKRITTFTLSQLPSQNTVAVIPEQEILESEEGIAEFAPSEAKIDFESAIKISNNCKEKNYPKEMLLKLFFILQQREGKLIYNVTYFTRTFNTINVRIDALTGEILKHTKDSLMGDMLPGQK